MRYLYTLFLFFLLPLLPIRLLWRSLKSPAYRHHWAQRFGYHYPQTRPKPIWIHAVSFGETQAALPLIKQLQQHYPNNDVLLTHMTPTGMACAAKLSDIHQCYLPYDYPLAVKRFLEQTQPLLGIIMETELWPNLLYTAKQKNIPMILANARLSARSAQAYQRYAARLTQQTLMCFNQIAVQTDVEAQRFIELGAKTETVTVTGSIKFDVTLDKHISAKAQALRQTWGKNRLVWIAASTHEGEDEHVLAAFLSLRQQIKDLLLVIVPRHPERFGKVTALCQQAIGADLVCRRTQDNVTDKIAIYVGDTMGDLPLLYASADVAFIGGSLVPTGGHNILEPALVALPIVFGQHMFNFKHISQQFVELEAATQIQQANQLTDTVLLYLQDKTLRQQAGQRGQQFVDKNRGALQRLLQCIDTSIASID